MEERNVLLRENLTLLYKSNLAAAVCLVLAFIPFVNLIAIFVALGAAIMTFVAMWRLRNVHDDYHTAVMLTIINVALTLIGGLVGRGLESVIDVISSLVSFAQTYYIIRATNTLLEETMGYEAIEKGKKTVKLYVVNLIVSLISAAAALILGESGLGITLVLLALSLIVTIVAAVSYIQYLSRAKDYF